MGKLNVLDAFEVFVLLEHGGDENAALKAAKAMIPKPKQSPFKLSPINDLLKQPPPFEWLIRGWLQPQSEVMVIGESTVGKSFAMVDMALCIATGKEWNGCKVKQAPVVYITGEGYMGLRMRVKAWGQEFGSLDNAPFVLSEQPADFMDKDNLAAVDEAIGEFAVAHDGKVGVVVVDTLIRNMIGDENSADDFAQFSGNLQQLCRKYEAASVVVHHPGHGDKGRGRGTSAQKGNQDTLLLLSQSGEDRMMECDKMKDGAEPPLPVGFELKQVTIPWKDDEGKKLTSCICKWVDAPAEKTKKMPQGTRLGLETFLHINPNPKDGVDLDEWRKEFYRKHTGDTPTAKQKAFQRARKDLVESKVMAVTDDVYTIIDMDNYKWSDTAEVIIAARVIASSNKPDRQDKA